MNKQNPHHIKTALSLLLFAATIPAFAGSATWSATPQNSSWSNAVNWGAGGPPNAATDVATFDISATTSITLSASTQLAGIVFNAGASAYNITAFPTGKLSLLGAGIGNTSGAPQLFVVSAGGGQITFSNNSSAGTNSRFTNRGSATPSIGGQTQFFNAATAANGTFVNEGGRSVAFANGGATGFFDSTSAGSGSFTTNGATFAGAFGGITAFANTSSAGNGTFTTNGGTVSGAAGGITSFSDATTASSGVFENNGGAASGASGGSTQFASTATAGNSTITTNGGTVVGAAGGTTQFTSSSSAGSSTLIANGGTGQGGQIAFLGDSTGGTARVKVYGNGNLDISAHTALGVSIGSLEGSGNVFLGNRTLTVGSLNLSSTLSGTIRDGGNSGGTLGSLTKTGTGTLTLSGANAYTGTTTVNAGILAVDYNGTTTFGVLGSGVVTTNGGTSFGASGGSTQFYNMANAGNGTFVTNSGAVSSAQAGSTQFFDNSNAGNASFTTNGGAFSGANGGGTRFWDAATAGHASFVNNGGITNSAQGGFTGFSNNSTAGSASFTNNGGMMSAANGGNTGFADNSTADFGVFVNNGSSISGAIGGSTLFQNTSTAGSGTITSNGATVSGGYGGSTQFIGTSTAGNATITANGGTVVGANGGSTQFYFSSTAGNSRLIANAGLGNGGQIMFAATSTGGTAQVEVYGNGNLDISANALGVSIGSIDGSGNVFLGAKNLTVGSNNISTTFSGIIQDGGNSGGILGSVTKVGVSTLALSGSNTYAGGTILNSGTLIAANNSAFGLGSITINSGTLIIQSGITISNRIVLNGGDLAQTFSAGTSLTQAIHTTSDIGGTQTVAQLLDGTTSNVATLESSFAGVSLASNDEIRLSDVFSLSGVPVINGLTGQTDTFVLQLQIVDANSESFLGWLDPSTNQWINAVYGNIGGAPFFSGDHAYNPATDFNLGTYGVDTVNNTVWAVLNHNSEFAVIPEPASNGLLGLGLVVALLGGRSLRGRKSPARCGGLPGDV